MSEVDPKLVDIFLYHFGVDLSEDRYKEARRELAEYFSDKIQEWTQEFYAKQSKADKASRNE